VRKRDPSGRRETAEVVASGPETERSSSVSSPGGVGDSFSTEVSKERSACADMRSAADARVQRSVSPKTAGRRRADV